MSTLDSLLQDPAWTGDASVQGVDSLPDASVESRGSGNWPRMIVLDDEVEERLIHWIDSEIEAYYLEREPLLKDWKKWQNLFWANPAQKEKNFPFKRAANIVIPLAAIAVEAIHARIMNTLFSVEPFWSIRPRSKEWIQTAKPFEKYLQTEVENGETLNLYEFCNEATLELTKLGTGVSKTGYERLTKKSLRAIGDTEEEIFSTIKNGATVGRVPLGNFILRLAETDPQTSPMVGEKHEFTWSQLKRMAQDGRMRPEAIEEIKHRWRDFETPAEANDGTDLQKEVREGANVEPLWSHVFDVHELWISFDVDGDGWDEEIVVDYHKESRTFLSIRYNWYDDLHRPYRIGRFLVVEGIWPGIGVCKQVEQFQEEATTIHRQRLDNATLANMTQLAIRKNSGYGPGEPIFPGKMWFLDDPTKDIAPVKLSEVYPSSYENESSIIRYFEKRSGANEVILGIPQTGTPGTATSDLTRLAEGNKRFDLNLKNIKRWLSLIGVDVITNYQIFGNQRAHWMTQGEDGIWVERVLNMPSILVRRGAVVDLTVTDSITNKEVEQQQWLQLFQVITNYYDRVLQLAQLFGPELFAQMAQKALMASDEAFRRLLETFDVPDSDRFALAEEDPNAAASQGNPGSAPVTPELIGSLSPDGGQGSPGSNRLGPPARLGGNGSGP